MRVNFLRCRARTPCRSAVPVTAPARARVVLAFVEEGDAQTAYRAVMVVVPILSFQETLPTHGQRAPLESLQSLETVVVEAIKFELPHRVILLLRLLLLLSFFPLLSLLQVRHICPLRRCLRRHNRSVQPQQLHMRLDPANLEW